MTAKSNANVRSGPDTAYGKVGTLKAGATYRVNGQSETPGWWQISFDGKDAWVSADLVDVNGPTETVAVVQVAPPPTAVPVAAAAAPAAAAAKPAAATSAKKYAAAPGQFGYGLQIPNYNEAGFSGQVAGMGFNWVKYQIPWKDVEGSPGNRDWGGVDGKVSASNGAGLKVLLSVPKAPAWARPGNSDLSVEGPPADPNTYASFVGADGRTLLRQSPCHRSMERAESLVRVGRSAPECGRLRTPAGAPPTMRSRPPARKLR